MDGLIELLADAWGLGVERIEPAPRGWTGETFAVDLKGGGPRVFVKVYPPELLPPTTVPALPVLAELRAAGQAEIAPPIATTDGGLSARLGDKLVVLFDHLEAERIRPFPFGGEECGELIGRVHAATAAVGCPVMAEAFDRPYAGELWRMLAAVVEDRSDDEARRLTRGWVVQQQGLHAELWRRFGETAEQLRAAAPAMVVTHGDWSFNLLRRDDGTTFLVDWDELLLAPPERDTWFVTEDVEGFWRGYRRARPGAVEDPLATRFYLQNRYFEEVLGSVRLVLVDTPLEQRLSALKLLETDWIVRLRARGWPA